MPGPSDSSCDELCEGDGGEAEPSRGELPADASRSRNSGSWGEAEPAPKLPVSCVRAFLSPGLMASRIGLVTRFSGISSAVSKTKKASPASPIFIEKGMSRPLTKTSTCKRVCSAPPKARAGSIYAPSCPVVARPATSRIVHGMGSIQAHYPHPSTVGQCPPEGCLADPLVFGRL